MRYLFSQPPRLVILPLLCGLAYWCGTQGVPWSLAAWVCLTPLGLALYRATPRQGLATGLLSGFSAWFAGVWWLRNHLVALVGLPAWQAWGWTALFCLWHAVPYAVTGWLAARFRWLERPGGAFMTAATLVVLRGWYPQVFPGSEAHILADMPLLIQILDLGGTPLLLLTVYLVGLLVSRSVILWRERRSPAAPLAAVAVIFLLLTGYGGYRLRELRREMATAPGRQWLDMVAVQPNLAVRAAAGAVPQGEGVPDVSAALAFAQEAALRHPAAELVVLPELPCGYSCMPEAARDLPRLTAVTGKQFMAPCTGLADEQGSACYNSVVHAGRDGVVGEEYRKLRLTPFGEYLPLERSLPWLRRLFPGVMRFSPGERVVLYDLGQGRRAIPALCYEAIFSEQIRKFVQRGGNILINMADDAWFGQSRASEIHLSLTLFRSVEFRIPLARVTNSGVSVCVQPTGEVIPGSRTPLFRKAVTAARLYIPAHRAPYAGWDGLFFTVLTFCWPALLAREVRVNMKTQRGSKPSSPHRRITVWIE